MSQLCLPLSQYFPDLLMHVTCAQSLQLCPTLSDPVDCSPTRLLYPWDFPGKNNGVGCHVLLWESSEPWDQTRASCIAGGFFTTEPPGKPMSLGDLLMQLLLQQLWAGWLTPCILFIFSTIKKLYNSLIIYNVGHLSICYFPAVHFL